MSDLYTLIFVFFEYLMVFVFFFSLLMFYPQRFLCILCVLWLLVKDEPQDKGAEDAGGDAGQHLQRRVTDDFL